MKVKVTKNQLRGWIKEVLSEIEEPEEKETPAEEPVKLTKFPKKLQEKVEMSKEDYDKMTSQQKYLYNFNNLNK